MEWAKRNRLFRLQEKTGYFFILALDHPLTTGVIDGLEDIGKWISFANVNEYISSIVLNKGEIQRLTYPICKGLIVQTMALPETSYSNLNKVVVSNINEAIQLSSDAISLQLCFESKDINIAIEKIGSLISEAHTMSYPVMIMVNECKSRNKPLHDVADKIKICTQLGADIVKVSLPELDHKDPLSRKLAKNLPYCSPTVLASGGKKDIASFKRKLDDAKKIGFSGVCVGRQIFQSENFYQVTELIHKAFAQ